MTDAPAKPVKRKCRYCGRTFKVPRDYPKRRGCPECAPTLQEAIAETTAKDAA